MENSDGLFKVTCFCGAHYAPETYQECPVCNASIRRQAALILDIDKFYEKVLSLQTNHSDDAMDVIMDVFFNLWDKYDVMNDILAKADVSKMSGAVMCGILTNTFKYSEQVPNHKVFFLQACEEYSKRGKTPEQVKKTLGGLEGAGNHWEYMTALGATGWIWGPNPNK